MAIVPVPASSQDCVESLEKTDGRGRDSDESSSVISKLARTIEGEVIPRLLLAHVLPAKVRRKETRHWQKDPEEVHKFGVLIVGLNPSGAFRFIESAHEAGRPLENIITELLAPTAIYLGELWKDDRCSFTEVTVGLSRLQQILRTIGPDFEDEKRAWRHGRRALLLPAPGEQHTLGIYVVEAFFRREGWDVYGGPIESISEILQLAKNHWFAIAGFSLSSERFLDRLASLIKSLRRTSCNKDIAVLVGGPVFKERPALAFEVGADGSAADAGEAVARAGVLLGNLHR